MATAIAGLLVALTAQFVAHRATVARERSRERSDAFDAALRTAHAVGHHLDMLAVAVAQKAEVLNTTKRPGVVVNEVAPDYFEAAERFHGDVISYLSRCGHDQVGQRLKEAADALDVLSRPGTRVSGKAALDAALGEVRGTRTEFSNHVRAAARDYNPSLAAWIGDYAHPDTLAAEMNAARGHS